MFALRAEVRKIFAPLARHMSGYPGGVPGLVSCIYICIYLGIYDLQQLSLLLHLSNRIFPSARDLKVQFVLLYLGLFWVPLDLVHRGWLCVINCCAMSLRNRKQNLKYLCMNRIDYILASTAKKRFNEMEYFVSPLQLAI